MVDDTTEEDRPLVEGTLKSIFAYATECGYVTFDPCKDLNFEGSIEEEEKTKQTVKSRLINFGLKKIAKPFIDKQIEKSTKQKDK